MIKAIIFDWGGVLIHNPAPLMYEFLAQKLGVGKEQFPILFKPYEADLTQGKISEKELWTRIGQDLNRNFEIANWWKEAVDYAFQDQIAVHDLAHQLKAQGYRTSFLSNTELSAMHYFYDHHYDNFLESPVFSCVEGCQKPQPEIYQIACERLGLKPEETVFIDDKLPYIEGSRRLGMHGIVFENVEQLKRELTLLGVKID